jgi:hypothetical protein
MVGVTGFEPATYTSRTMHRDFHSRGGPCGNLVAHVAVF